MVKLTRPDIIPPDYSVQQLAVDCVTLHNYDTSQCWVMEVMEVGGGVIVVCNSLLTAARHRCFFLWVTTTLTLCSSVALQENHRNKITDYLTL